MSLMRFLVVGSSLRGVKDRPSPYKMTQQHLLPKFGPGKEAEGKTGVSVLTTTEEDSDLVQSPKSKVQSQVSVLTTTEEDGDGKDAEADGACAVQSAAPPETEERKTNMPANLNIETASERVGSSLAGAAEVVREPLPDG